MDVLDQPAESHQPKERHGCVTAWLYFMIVTNALLGMAYVFASDMMAESMTGDVDNSSTVMLLGLVSLVNFVLAIMLLKWMKWGFYGFMVTSVLAVMLNLALGLGVGSSLAGLIGIVILYGILQIKQKERSTWEQLE